MLKSHPLHNYTRLQAKNARGVQLRCTLRVQIIQNGDAVDVSVSDAVLIPPAEHSRMRLRPPTEVYTGMAIMTLIFVLMPVTS